MYGDDNDARKGYAMRGVTADATTTEVEELSQAEGREMFAAQVSDRLGMRPDEFLARMDDGEFDETDDEGIVRLMMLAPFAR
jgi:hypothetical protein